MENYTAQAVTIGCDRRELHAAPALAFVSVSYLGTSVFAAKRERIAPFANGTLRAQEDSI